MTPYNISDLVSDFRDVAADTNRPGEIVRRVRPLALRAAASKAWLKPDHYRCGAEQGFGSHLLYEEPDHSLAIFAFSWLPGRGTPPHDHGTWGVVAGVDGSERNVHWRRLDDESRAGYAELERLSEEIVAPGECASFLPRAIHSVHNDTDRVTLSLHIYGRHINHTGRSQFDPDSRTARPYVVSID